MPSHLKVRFRTTREKGYWNPAGVTIMLNDTPLDLVQSLAISFDVGEFPSAVIKLKLDSLDIDADSLLHLMAVADITPEELVAHREADVDPSPWPARRELLQNEDGA